MAPQDRLPGRWRGGDSFPVGDSEVARLIRGRDWSNSPLGPVESWPETLRLSLQNALNTTFPISILWGEELLQFYNDVYAHLMMGTKHPRALGEPVRHNWQEFWDDIRKPLREVCQQGGSVQQQEVKMQIDRGDGGQDVYFNFSYAPIFGASNHVEGVLVSVIDTTERVISRRRLRTLGALGSALSTVRDSHHLLETAVDKIADNREDIPFALLYLQDDKHPHRARLVDSIHIDAGTIWSPHWLELPHDGAGDALARALVEPYSACVDLVELFGGYPEQFQSSGIRRAFIVSMASRSAQDELPVGEFVFGLPPGRIFDDDYRNFLMEIARNTAIAYHNARQREDELDLARTRTELTRQRRRSHRFRKRARVLDSIELPFLAVDDQWRIVYANQAIRRDPHIPPEDTPKILGQNFWKLSPYSCDSQLAEAFDQVLSTGESLELEMKSPDDERVYGVHVFAWERGVAVTFEDVTEQHRTAEALKRSEARFRAVVESSLDVIAIADEQGRYQFVSPAADRLLGTPADDIVGNSIFDFVAERDVDEARRAFQQLLDVPEEPHKVQVRTRCKTDNGEHRWLSIYGANCLDVPGVDGILLNIREITDIKEFEAQLVEAKKRAEESTQLKSAILANTSHEIRTPLTSMIGMANVLAREVPEQQARLAEKIERSGMRLSQTLDSVLTLAKIESGVLEVKTEDVDLGAESETATQALRKLAADKGLELKLEVIDSPLIRADTTFLTSILNNLIGNAIKFTDEGEVVVRVRKNERCGVIEVEDTGIGIGAEFLPHLFEQFRQESAGLARSHEGVGLGLALARQMTEELGGRITVLSTQGGGSTFTVTIPRSDINSESKSDSSDRKPSRVSHVGEGHRHSVLVVEDDDSIRFMLEQLLEQHFDVTLVPDATTALQMVNSRKFDLIVLDIGLPDMNGIELLEHIRDIPEYKNRPVAALTGYALPGEHRRSARRQFDDHISKPFVPEELIARLKQLL